jgi:uncharacterized membrane protein YcaP (DUF421 family)
LLDWLSYKFPSTRPILKPPALKLIPKWPPGTTEPAQEMLSEEELKSQLRELEIEEYSEVKLCTLEGDGRLHVLKVKPAA